MISDNDPKSSNLSTIFQCPISKSGLVTLNDRQIEALNERILKGNLVHLDGTTVKRRLESGLASEDGRFIYREDDGVKILLPSLAIAAREDALGEGSRALASAKNEVKNYYDQIGWQKNSEYVYKDTLSFEELRSVSSDYIQECHLRLGEHFQPRGTYLLDVACGPIPYPVYLEYSAGYDYRICADISLLALREAKKKLGDRGIYVLCDITNVPLKAETVDAFVSLHTIYHVPAEEQIDAVGELHRVLRKGRSGAIVYTWGSRSLLMMPAHPVETTKWIARAMLPESVVNGLKDMIRGKEGGEPRLYFHAHCYSWYRERVESKFDADLSSWRSVSVPFLRRFIHECLLGRQLLSALFALESKFPRFFGRFGQYPVFVFRK